MIKKTNILEIIYPSKCGICGNLDKDGLCDECYTKLNKNVRNRIICPSKKLGIVYFQVGMYIYDYKDIRNLMINYKFNQKSYLNKLFFKLITKNNVIQNYINKFDVIIPVPIHKNRYRERGYNQISLILKNMYDNRILERNLVKIVDNKRQSTLNLEERKINIKKSYKITDVDVIQGKRVLIVDDIYTTGNTLNECSRILKENGAEIVGILAIAKD